MTNNNSESSSNLNNKIKIIRGKRGKQGDAGLNGLNGQNGPTGPTGPAGDNGLDGQTGPAGNDGSTGPAGPITLLYFKKYGDTGYTDIESSNLIHTIGDTFDYPLELNEGDNILIMGQFQFENPTQTQNNFITLAASTIYAGPINDNTGDNTYNVANNQTLTSGSADISVNSDTSIVQTSCGNYDTQYVHFSYLYTAPADDIYKFSLMINFCSSDNLSALNTINIFQPELTILKLLKINTGPQILYTISGNIYHTTHIFYPIYLLAGQIQIALSTSNFDYDTYIRLFSGYQIYDGTTLPSISELIIYDDDNRDPLDTTSARTSFIPEVTITEAGWYTLDVTGYYFYSTTDTGYGGNINNIDYPFTLTVKKIS